MQARHDLISHLERSFKNADEKKQCLDSCRDILEPHITTRAFDLFPSLLPNTELEQFRSKFTEILHHIKRIHKSDDGYDLIDKSDMIQLADLHKQIIQIGYAELINKNSNRLKANIVAYFGWESAQDKIEISSILCAYVGAISQELMRNNDAITEKNNDFCTAVFCHINKNYRTWVNEVLKTNGNRLHPTHATMDVNGHTIQVSQSSNTYTTAASVLTAGVLVATALGGFLLFHHANTTSQPNESEQRARNANKRG